MANIAKADLVKTVSADSGLSAKDTKAIINLFLATTETYLSQGHTVQITGFGSFEVRERSARTGVKPGTSEKIEIPAAKYPAYKPGKGLKDSIK